MAVIGPDGGDLVVAGRGRTDAVDTGAGNGGSGGSDEQSREGESGCCGRGRRCLARCGDSGRVGRFCLSQGPGQGDCSRRGCLGQ